MAKHHSKEAQKGEATKLVGTPTELINLLITDVNEKKWVTGQLENEGPKHKQVLSALLLKRLYKMVQALEKKNGIEFVMQDGYELIIEKDKETKVIPVPVPINLARGLDKQKVIEAISHAPEHEVLAYAMSLQVIEWVIKEAGKK